MNDLKYIVFTLLIGVILGVLCTFIVLQEKSPVTGRYKWRVLTNTYTVTNYGKVAEYIKIPRLDVSNITNFFDITNLRVEILSNFRHITNRITITNIIDIINDYTGFYESPFVFAQTNDDLTVRLYKREGYYKIRYPSPAMHRLFIAYPLMASYQYRLGHHFNIDWLSVGTYVSLPNISNFNIGLGIGIEF